MYLLILFITCRCQMSSPKSKKRSSAEMEESVDMVMDTDIPHQVNDPTEGAPTSKSKASC